ncbi:hypothetical protein QQ045_009626 [Rhodiola kirilowii]
MEIRIPKKFHVKASHRKQKSWFTKLKDSQGIIHEEEEKIMDIITEYFCNIFQPSISKNSEAIDAELRDVSACITEEMNMELLRDISEEEIKRADFSLGPLKALGIDGFPAVFYQKFWENVKASVVSEVKRFWTEGFLDKEMNKTLITLIPKNKDADKVEDWRPISLCTVAIKIITKILAMRLQPILDQVISPFQSAFVKDRIFSDNFVIAHEILHFLNNRRDDKNLYASIKVDMSKAFDRVEWLKKKKSDLSSVFSVNTKKIQARGSTSRSRRVPQVSCHSKYLKLPLVVGQRKTATFRNIIEKIWKKVQDWKTKLLSAAGREVLVTAVIQAIPVYMMSVYQFPKKVISDLSKLIQQFWLGAYPSHIWRGIMRNIHIFLRGIWWEEDGVTCRWRHTGDWGFSVKSAYEVIKVSRPDGGTVMGEQSDGSKVHKFWKKFWATKIPNKVKPDALNLRRRGISLDCRCQLCGCRNETALHVVRDCWWAHIVYREHGLDPASYARPDVNPADWVWSCRTSCSKEDFRVLMVAAWVCWKNRNRVWHGQDSWFTRLTGLVGRSLLKLPAIQFYPRPLENANIDGSWSPPEVGCIKINTDGSWDVLTRMAGIGIVSRDHFGTVLWTWANQEDCCFCAGEVEGRALVRSLELAARFEARKVTFEVDSLEACKSVSTGKGWVSGAYPGSTVLLGFCIPTPDEL